MRLQKRKFGFIIFPYMLTGGMIFALMPDASARFSIWVPDVENGAFVPPGAYN